MISDCRQLKSNDSDGHPCRFIWWQSACPSTETTCWFCWYKI